MWKNAFIPGHDFFGKSLVLAKCGKEAPFLRSSFPSHAIPFPKIGGGQWALLWPDKGERWTEDEMKSLLDEEKTRRGRGFGLRSIIFCNIHNMIILPKGWTTMG